MELKNNPYFYEKLTNIIYNKWYQYIYDEYYRKNYKL